MALVVTAYKQADGDLVDDVIFRYTGAPAGTTRVAFHDWGSNDPAFPIADWNKFGEVAGTSSSGALEYDDFNINERYVAAVAYNGTTLLERSANVNATVSGLSIDPASAGPDVTPPTAPVISAVRSGADDVDLAVTTLSADAVGVTGYEFHGAQATTNFTPGPGTIIRASASGTTYTHTEPTTGQTWRYTARARDAAGNWSAYATQRQVTIPIPAPEPDPDGPTPGFFVQQGGQKVAVRVRGRVVSGAEVAVTVGTPGQGGAVPAPLNLQAVAQPGPRIALTWNHIPGAVDGVTPYDIGEPKTVGRPVATVTTNSRTSGNLTYGDYTYSVRAAATANTPAGAWAVAQTITLAPPVAVPEPTPAAGALTWGLPSNWGQVHGAEKVVNVTTATTRIETPGDYRVKLPEGTAWTQPFEVFVPANAPAGIRVAIIGGQIATTGTQLRPLFLNCQGADFVHIEGVRLSGADNRDGVRGDFRKFGSVVQIQNCQVDRLYGSDADHADPIQIWSGPATLRIDRFEGESDYQGFILHPRQFGPWGASPAELKQWTIKNTWVKFADSTAGIPFTSWHDSATGNPDIVAAENVYVTAPLDPSIPASISTVGNNAPRVPYVWGGVQVGVTPPGGTVLSGTPGASYVSPGYVGQVAASTDAPTATASNTGIPAGTTLTAGTAANFESVSGTAATPLVVENRDFTGVAGAAAYVRGSYVTFRNCRWNHDVITQSTHHVRFERCEAKKFSVSSAQDIHFQDVKVNQTYTGPDAMSMQSDNGARTARVTVDGLYAYGNKATQVNQALADAGGSPNHYDGIQFRGAEDVLVKNAVLESAAGIHDLTTKPAHYSGSQSQWDALTTSQKRSTYFGSVFNAALYFENANGGNKNIRIERSFLRCAGYATVMLFAYTGYIEFVNCVFGNPPPETEHLRNDSVSPSAQSGNVVMESYQPGVRSGTPLTLTPGQ